MMPQDQVVDLCVAVSLQRLLILESRELSLQKEDLQGSKIMSRQSRVLIRYRCVERMHFTPGACCQFDGNHLELAAG